MDGDAFNDLHFQACRAAGVAQGEDAFSLPDLADRDVIHGGNDTGHARNLPDIGQRDAVAGTVPAEYHFHRLSSFLSLQLQL